MHTPEDRVCERWQETNMNNINHSPRTEPSLLGDGIENISSEINVKIHQIPLSYYLNHLQKQQTTIFFTGIRLIISV